MPALSPTMAQGNVNSWEVKEGDELEAGTILATIETDKATLEWENQVQYSMPSSITRMALSLFAGPKSISWDLCKWSRLCLRSYNAFSYRMQLTETETDDQRRQDILAFHFSSPRRRSHCATTIYVHFNMLSPLSIDPRIAGLKRSHDRVAISLQALWGLLRRVSRRMTVFLPRFSFKMGPRTFLLALLSPL